MTTRKEYIILNEGKINYNLKGHLIVLGCNYHTTWQSKKKMRFVLDDVKGKEALLFTRVSKRRFKTNVDDLIFISSGHNIRKAKDLLGVSGILPVTKPMRPITWKHTDRETLENEAEQASMETSEHLEQT